MLIDDVKLREKLRSIDLDVNGKMGLLEYLCFRYKKSAQGVLDAPQGDPKEVEKAQKKLQEVQVNSGVLLA